MYVHNIAELGLTPESILDYLRKSRTDDPSLSVEEVLAKHEELLDKWNTENLGRPVPPENKHKEVVSGETIQERPAFRELLRRIESPRIKAIKAADEARLSRGDLEDAGRLIKLLRHTNTLVIIPDVYGGQFVYNLRDEDDREKFERKLKEGNQFLEYQKKIMRRGRELSVQRGNFIGQKAPYGYRKIVIPEGKKKCHTLEIEPAEADVVRMIFDMYVNQDMGCVNIGHRLNELGVPTRTGALWGQETLKRMLNNHHYVGKVRWNFRKTVTIVEEGEIKQVRPMSNVGEYLLYDGKHEAIISDELFQAAQEKRGRNPRAKSKVKIRNPLAGLLFCKCGRAMSLRTYKYSDAEPRLLCDNQKYCGTTSCTYAAMIDRVREILQQCIADFEVRIKDDNKDAAALHVNLIKRLEAKRAELDAKEIAQWEAQADPDPAKRMPAHIFQVLNEKLLKEKEEVREALCKAYESMPEPVNYEDKLVRFQTALEALDDPEASPAKKNKLLKECIDRIEYHREKAVRKTRVGKKKRVTINGKRKVISDLQSGANWTETPIELDVKLRL